MIYDIKPLTSETPGFGFEAGDVGNGSNRSTERLREPSGGGDEPCNSLKLYTETVVSTVKLKVGAGQIGSHYFAGKELGSLSSKHGHIVYIQTDLNGTNGTYTSDVKTATTFPTGSPTKSYFSIGTISATGAIRQQMCGNFVVNVCRNWFTATAPYYNMSISGISRNYFNQ
jgi:hypothetical protein